MSIEECASLQSVHSIAGLTLASVCRMKRRIVHVHGIAMRSHRSPRSLVQCLRE